METEKETRDRSGNPEGPEGETVLHVRIPTPLGRQLEELLGEPSFGFTSLEHLILSGLWSFAGYKRRQLERLRADAAIREGRRW